MFRHNSSIIVFLNQVKPNWKCILSLWLGRLGPNLFHTTYQSATSFGVSCHFERLVFLCNLQPMNLNILIRIVFHPTVLLSHSITYLTLCHVFRAYTKAAWSQSVVLYRVTGSRYSSPPKCTGKWVMSAWWRWDVILYVIWKEKLVPV